MNEKDLNDFRLLFENMREQLIAKVKLNDNTLAGLNTGDIVEQTNSERDVQVLLKLEGRDRFMMMKIEHALDKIDNKTYGQCEECDGEISMNRLLARPVATQCICCKEEQENIEKQIDYNKRSKTTGKTLVNSNNNVISFSNDDNSINESSHQVNLDKWQDRFESSNLQLKSI